MRPRHHLGQAVVGLRAEHQIDIWGPAQYLGPFGLRHAPGDADHHRPRPAVASFLLRAKAP